MVVINKTTMSRVAIYDSFFFVHHYALTRFLQFVVPKYPRFARTPVSFAATARAYHPDGYSETENDGTDTPRLILGPVISVISGVAIIARYHIHAKRAWD